MYKCIKKQLKNEPDGRRHRDKMIVMFVCALSVHTGAVPCTDIIKFSVPHLVRIIWFVQAIYPIFPSITSLLYLIWFYATTFAHTYVK